MNLGIFIALFIFGAPLMGQEEDLAVIKERMNTYLDRRLELVQQAKDCVLIVSSTAEVNGCKRALLDNIEEYKQRTKDNKNGPTMLKE